jgi:hypothetical protein
LKFFPQVYPSPISTSSHHSAVIVFPCRQSVDRLFFPQKASGVPC